MKSKALANHKVRTMLPKGIWEMGIPEANIMMLPSTTPQYTRSKLQEHEHLLRLWGLSMNQNVNKTV